MATIPSLPGPVLQKVADIIDDTGEGLTGSEIGRFLAQVDIAQQLPERWHHRHAYETCRLAKRHIEGEREALMLLKLLRRSGE